MATAKETQQFCVRWNSYQSNLQSAFPKLLTNEHFVDVTLACESRMVKCHKVVLSACSAYFEKLLVQNPCQHPIIFMKDMKYWEVQALVDFMYKGEVNVTQDELASLLKAAEALEVRGLCGQHEGGSGSLSLNRGPEGGADKKRRMDSEVKDLNTGGSSSSSSSGPNTEFTPTSQTPNLSTMTQSGSNPDITKPDTSHSTTPSGSNIKQECSSNMADNGLFEDLDDDFYQDDNSLQIDETGSAYSLAGPSVQLDCSPGSNRTPRNRQLLQLQYYKKYSPETLEKAVRDLLAGKFQSMRACARFHGIPMTTLRYRAKVMAHLSATSKGNHWNLNNGYPNVILTETCSSNFSTPSPSNETPGKIQRIRRSDAELLSAADSICKGMTFQKASQTFNIPMSTIRFYMARKGMLPSRRRGRRISQGMEQNMQGGQSSHPQPPPQHQTHPSPSPSLGTYQMPSMSMSSSYFKPEPSGY